MLTARGIMTVLLVTDGSRCGAAVVVRFLRSGSITGNSIAIVIRVTLSFLRRINYLVQNVVIEPIGNTPFVRINIDGADISSKTNEAKIVFEPGALPVLTLSVPFVQCKYSGKCIVEFETDESYMLVDTLIAENKNMKQIIDDLNRKIAILLDT